MPTRPHILMVEDDPFLIDIAVRKFAQGGFDVTHVATGEDALKKLETFTPQAISLDVMLPGIDGYEVLRRLKADERLAKIPVVVFSNIGNEEDVDKAKELGAIDYLVKISVSFEEVIERFKAVCHH